MHFLMSLYILVDTLPQLHVVFGWLDGELDPDNRQKRSVTVDESGRQDFMVGYTKGVPEGDNFIQLSVEVDSTGSASMFALP